jgi:hypothetical protein
LLAKYVASHTFSPSSVSQGYVEIRTLSLLGGGSRCGGDSCTGYYLDDLRLLRHTSAYREGIVLKPAWNWGSNSSVANDPLEEAGRIPPTARGSVDGDRMFFPFQGRAP